MLSARDRINNKGVVGLTLDAKRSSAEVAVPVSELHLDEVERDGRAQPGGPVDASVPISLLVNSKGRGVVASVWLIGEVKDWSAGGSPVSCERHRVTRATEGVVLIHSHVEVAQLLLDPEAFVASMCVLPLLFHFNQQRDYRIH